MTVDARAWRWMLVCAALPPVLLTLVVTGILLIGMMLLARRSRIIGVPPRWTQRIEPALVASVGAVATLITVWMVHGREIQDRNEAFVQLAASRTAAITKTLRNLQSTQLEGLAKFYENGVSVTPEAFRQFTTFLTKDPAVQAWEWVPAVPAADRARFEEEARAAGLKGFEIWQKDAQGNRVPVAGREVYYPIFLVAPLAGNEGAPGYDLGSEPARRAALEEAARIGLPTGTDPVTLLQQGDNRSGMVVYRPVTGGDSPKHLDGFAVAVLRMETLLKSAGSDQSVLMELSLLRKEAPAEPLAASWDTDTAPLSGLFTTHPVFAFGKAFLATAHAGPEFMRLHPMREGWLAALFGLLLTAASTLLISVIVRRHEHLEQLVSQRTAALYESQIRFDQLAEQSGTVTWEVDPQGLITYVSHVVEQVLGYGPAELIDKRFFYELYVEAERERLKARLVAIFEKRKFLQNFERVLLAKDGRHIWMLGNAIPVLNADGTLRGYQCSSSDITERKQAELRVRLQTGALEAAANAIVITNNKGVIQWANAAFTTFTGYSVAEVTGNTPSRLKSGYHDQAFYHNLWETVLAGQVWRGEMVNRRKDGSLYTEEMTITPLKDNAGEVTHFIAVKQDITERKKVEAERQQFEIQLRQAQKMESIGSLAAGIAHEINTPIQFVLNNVVFLRNAFSSLSELHERYYALLARLDAGTLGQERAADIEDAAETDKIKYFTSEIPLAIQQSIEGVDRVAKIVRAMKEFSHPGLGRPTPTDLNQAIASTLTVCRSEWKRVAEVVTCLDPDLPLVPCFSSEINQVVLNIVVNAAHAIGDVIAAAGLAVEDADPEQEKADGGSLGTITVTTRRDGDWAELRISDTGAGIPEHVRASIFDPFFTTKVVGKGTGLGLAIAHSIIVKKHGGTIGCETAMDHGTTFIVRLPLNGPITA
jgi:PAS domain S-box-containing protein